MLNDIKARQTAYKTALDNVTVDREAYHKARIELEFNAYDDIDYLLDVIKRLQTTVSELINLCDTDYEFVREYTDAAHKLLDELEEK